MTVHGLTAKCALRACASSQGVVGGAAQNSKAPQAALLRVYMLPELAADATTHDLARGVGAEAPISLGQHDSVTRHVLVGPESGDRTTIDGNDIGKVGATAITTPNPASLALLPSTSTLAPCIATTTRKRSQDMSSMTELHREVRALTAARTLEHHEHYEPRLGERLARYSAAIWQGLLDLLRDQVRQVCSGM